MDSWMATLRFVGLDDIDDIWGQQPADQPSAAHAHGFTPLRLPRAPRSRPGRCRRPRVAPARREYGWRRPAATGQLRVGWVKLSGTHTGRASRRDPRAATAVRTLARTCPRRRRTPVRPVGDGTRCWLWHPGAGLRAPPRPRRRPLMGVPVPACRRVYRDLSGLLRLCRDARFLPGRRRNSEPDRPPG